MGVALLLIDMQKDFVLPDAPARVAGARATVPALVRLLGLARASGWLVVHVTRLHKADGSDVEAFRRPAFRAGRGICVEGSPGAEIIDELLPLPGEARVVKRRFSAFMNTGLDGLLRGAGARTVVIGGTQYPNCVRGTAVDAMSRDYRVVVVTDACSAQSDDVAEANIRDMRAMGIACVPLDGLAEELKRAAE
jgi:nicotinamidase-related amidase